MRLNIGVSALAAVLFASPVPAWALTPAVHDDAGFFSADAVTKADAIIKDIKERHHKDLLIETFPTPPADKEEEAKGDDGKANPSFFAAWALQRARRSTLTESMCSSAKTRRTSSRRSATRRTPFSRTTTAPTSARS